MEIISFIDPLNNEYKILEHKIEWKEKIKTKTHFIDSYLIDDSKVVVSKWKIKFICENCKNETTMIFSSFKNRKNNICISCIRKINLTGKKNAFHLILLKLHVS